MKCEYANWSATTVYVRLRLLLFFSLPALDLMLLIPALLGFAVLLSDPLLGDFGFVEGAICI